MIFILIFHLSHNYESSCLYFGYLFRHFPIGALISELWTSCYCCHNHALFVMYVLIWFRGIKNGTAVKKYFGQYAEGVQQKPQIKVGIIHFSFRDQKANILQTTFSIAFSSMKGSTFDSNFIDKKSELASNRWQAYNSPTHAHTHITLHQIVWWNQPVADAIALQNTSQT